MLVAGCNVVECVAGGSERAAHSTRGARGTAGTLLPSCASCLLQRGKLAEGGSGRLWCVPGWPAFSKVHHKEEPLSLWSAIVGCVVAPVVMWKPWSSVRHPTAVGNAV